MDDSAKVLESIHKVEHLRFTVINSENKVTHTDHVAAEKRVIESPIVEELLTICRERKTPKIMVNKFMLATAGLFVEKTKEVVILGPVFLGTKSEQVLQAELLKFYENQQEMRQIVNDLLGLHSMKQSKLISIIRFLFFYFNGNLLDLSDTELFEEVKGSDSETNLVSVEQENIYNQSIYKKMSVYEGYLQERKIMEAIQKGDKARILSITRNESGAQAGEMSREDAVIRQRKNEFICACTLATRAAIQGGMNVEKAYLLGNYHIRKIEDISYLEQISKSVVKMFLDFTIRVENLADKKKYSALINSSIQYINNHIEEAISIQKMADTIGVSKNHLLSKFKDETNTSIVDYIKIIKVSEAKLLLRYGYMEISEISEYFSFSSQSYFTLVFKELTGLTPKKYRDSHR